MTSSLAERCPCSQGCIKWLRGSSAASQAAEQSAETGTRSPDYPSECEEEEVDEEEKEAALAEVRENGRTLEHASEAMRSCKSVVLAAVQQYGMALQWASQRLRSDRAVVLAAVEQNPRAIEYTSEKMRGDVQIVLAAAQRDGETFRYASRQLKSDRRIVLAILRSSPASALPQVAPLNNDIVLARGQQGSHSSITARLQAKTAAFAHCAGKLKDDKDVVLAAVQLDPILLSQSSQRLKEDDDIVNAVRPHELLQKNHSTELFGLLVRCEKLIAKLWNEDPEGLKLALRRYRVLRVSLLSGRCCHFVLVVLQWQDERVECLRQCCARLDLDLRQALRYAELVKGTERITDVKALEVGELHDLQLLFSVT